LQGVDPVGQGVGRGDPLQPSRLEPDTPTPQDSANSWTAAMVAATVTGCFPLRPGADRESGPDRERRTSAGGIPRAGSEAAYQLCGHVNTHAVSSRPRAAATAG